MLPMQDIIIVTIYAILTTIDVTGNSILSHIIIAKCQRERKARDLIVLNMAITDLMVGIFFLPRHVLHHTFSHPGGMAGDMMCKFLTGGMLGWIGATGSNFCVVVLAFERYFAVIHPFKQRFTIKNVRVIIIACWIYANILMLPPFFVLQFDIKGNSCIENWTNLPAASQAYAISLLLFLLIFPFVILCYLYGRVIIRLWFKKTSTDSRQSVTQRFSARSRKSVTKMLLSVTMIYLICWASCLILYKMFGSEWNNSDPWHTVPEALLLLYSCINPYIFIFYDHRFRKHFMSSSKCFKSSPQSTRDGNYCNESVTSKTNEIKRRSGISHQLELHDIAVEN